MAPGTGPLASVGIHVSADDYYAAENWDVAKYWQRQAEAWGAPPPRGSVHVGDLVPMDSGSAGDEPPSDNSGHCTRRCRTLCPAGMVEGRPTAREAGKEKGGG